MLEALGLSRCPSCMHNFRQLVCYLSCSPWQSRILNVTRSRWIETDENTQVEAVDEVDYHVSELYAYLLYESCKDVQGLIPGTVIVDFLCGSWGGSHCNPERWMEFMGTTPADGGYSPFKINHVLHVEDKIKIDGHTFFPFKEPTYKCSESPKPGVEACSCYDCKESCSALALTPPFFPDPPEPFLIFEADGTIIISISIFILFVIIITLIFYFLKSPGHSKHQPVPFLESTPMCVNLGSLEEIEPLRSKNKPTVSPNKGIQNISQKLANRISKNAGYCLERQLEATFTSWGLFVSRRPVTVMVFSLLTFMVLSFGLILNFDVITNPVDLWVSSSSEARRDMEDYNKYFGPFYRIEHIIITPTNQEQFHHSIVVNHELKNISWGPAFQQDFLLAALDLQLQIENLTSTLDNTTVHLKDVCLSPLKPLNTECAIQSFFGFFQNEEEFFRNTTKYLEHFKSCSQVSTNAKCFAPFGGPIDSAAVVLGGFGNSFDSARALIITIPVPNYNDAAMTLKAKIWEAEFLTFIKNYSHPLMNVAFKAERSIQDEIERGSRSDLLPIAVSYLLMLFYITASLGEYNGCKTCLVESKFTLGFVGVLIVLLSVLSSLGLLSFLGIPITLIIVEVIPFLVLAVGVDNIFILVQAFQ
ncbi:NPC intracellular cholesterol transporter 1, partial [Nephila pilipes]